jgi:hypothetical protein
MTPLGADALRASFIDYKGVGQRGVPMLVTLGLLPYFSINGGKVGITLSLKRYFGDNETLSQPHGLLVKFSATNNKNVGFKRA